MQITNIKAVIYNEASWESNPSTSCIVQDILTNKVMPLLRGNQIFSQLIGSDEFDLIFHNIL